MHVGFNDTQQVRNECGHFKAYKSQLILDLSEAIRKHYYYSRGLFCMHLAAVACLCTYVYMSVHMSIQELCFVC